MAEDVTAHDLNAETAVLGAILANPDRLADVLDVITPRDFFREANQHVYRAFLTLTDRGEPIDSLTVVAALRSAGTLEAVGGPAYVSGLMTGVPRSTNARSYAQEILRAARFRRLEAAGTRIVAMARAMEDTAIEQAERLVYDIAQHRLGTDFVDGAALAHGAFASIERMAASRQHVTGVPSGFADFDYMTKGLQPGSLVILAARPSMGKTSLALNIAFHAAEQRHHTAFFSLEMSEQEVGTRLVSAVARVDAYRIQAGLINQTDYARISDAIGRIAESHIHVTDAASVSLMDIRGKARRLKAKHGLGLVVIDYLQLMALPRAENRNVAVAEVSRGLKLIARELEVPMLVLSQLSRSSEQRGGDKKPQLSDLRDSGAIEQDADVVVFIHRPEVYDPQPTSAGLAELVIAKQRNGPTGTVRLHWSKELTRFDALTHAHA